MYIPSGATRQLPLQQGEPLEEDGTASNKGAAKRTEREKGNEAEQESTEKKSHCRGYRGCSGGYGNDRDHGSYRSRNGDDMPADGLVDKEERGTCQNCSSAHFINGKKNCISIARPHG